jgi:threonylcarbamoyladenosine tRNA methylthiotransferase MtaB
VELWVVNTCTVTSKAEQKARRTIRALLRDYPAAVIIVTGCYARLNAADLEALSPEGRVKVRQKGADFFPAPESFAAHSRPLLKIQDGCDGECTYCRVRLARGKPVSLPAGELLQRVRRLEEAGHSEVVLTGVNIGAYAGGITPLMELLLANTARISFRLSSLHPTAIDEAFCRMAANARVRPHFHLSVQSGSDAVLRRMKRPYTAESTRQSVELLRGCKDRPFIACDIIAGFPGETVADFTATLDLARHCAFTWIHAFPFSPRPGTEAFALDGAVRQLDVTRRVAALEDLACANKIAYIESYLGKTLAAIPEHHSTHAVTENFIHVDLGTTLPYRAPGSGEIAVTISGVLEENIRSGAEIEANALPVLLGGKPSPCPQPA